ncbi:MAG: hypothetical protein ACJA06_000327 [Halocynthiibacter sp.]|jgi:hypothetical protein
MDYSKTKNSKLSKVGPSYREGAALGGPGNPFGGKREVPVIKPIVGKAKPNPAPQRKGKSHGKG